MDSSKAPVTGGDADAAHANPVEDPLGRRRYAAQEAIAPAAVANDRIVLVARARRVILARRFLAAMQAYRHLAFGIARARDGLTEVAFATGAIATGLAVNLLSYGSASDSLPGASLQVALFMLMLALIAALFVLMKAISEDIANWMKAAAWVLLPAAFFLVLGPVLLLEP